VVEFEGKVFSKKRTKDFSAPEIHVFFNIRKSPCKLLFTKLKSLCDEFDSYKAFISCTCIPLCSCGSMKCVNTFFD
jgi:hypothetical protein